MATWMDVIYPKEQRFDLAVKVQPGEEYVLSTNSAYNGLGVWFGEDIFLGFLEDGVIKFIATPQMAEKEYITLSTLEPVHLQDFTIKLEKGSIATDWTPAPEDLTQGYQYTLSQPIQPGTWYTISTDYTGDWQGLWIDDEYVGYLSEGKITFRSPDVITVDSKVVIKVLDTEAPLTWTKLEKGTKATDWTPAPEDVDFAIDGLDIRLTRTESTLIQHANMIATKVSQADFDLLEDRVSTAESTLIQHANEIATKVSQTDFDLLENRVTSAESTLTQHADMIATKVSQADFDLLEDRVSSAESMISQHANEIATKVSQTTFNQELAKKENSIPRSSTPPSNPTLNQLWIDTSVTPNILKRWSGSEWVKVTPTTAGEVNAYTKAETDSKLATKADADDLTALEGRVSTAESTLIQHANQIATKVSQTEFDLLEDRVTNAESTLTQHANEIALRVTQTTFNSAMDSINSELDSLDDRLSQAESTITQHADEIALRVRKDELGSEIVQNAESVKIAVGQIGGNNLLKNGNFVFDLKNWNDWGTATRTIESNYGKKWVRLQANDTQLYRGIQQDVNYFQPNKKFTISFLAYSPNGSKVHVRLYQRGDGNNDPQLEYTTPQLSTMPQKFIFTFTSVNSLQKNSFNFMIGGTPGAPFDVYITEIKFEEGEHATAWSPHLSEMYGTTYIFDGDSFKIGGSAGDRIEISPTYVQAYQNGVRRVHLDYDSLDFYSPNNQLGGSINAITIGNTEYMNITSKTAIRIYADNSPRTTLVNIDSESSSSGVHIMVNEPPRSAYVSISSGYSYPTLDVNLYNNTASAMFGMFVLENSAYVYFMPSTTTAQVLFYSDVDVSGTLRAEDIIESSSIENKTILSSLDTKIAYEKVKNLNIYRYKKRVDKKLVGELKENLTKRDKISEYSTLFQRLETPTIEQIGIILEEAPSEIIDSNKRGISLYSYISLVAGAVKEIQLKLEELERRIEDKR